MTINLKAFFSAQSDDTFKKNGTVIDVVRTNTRKEAGSKKIFKEICDAIPYFE